MKFFSDVTSKIIKLTNIKDAEVGCSWKVGEQEYYAYGRYAPEMGFDTKGTQEIIDMLEAPTLSRLADILRVSNKRKWVRQKEWDIDALKTLKKISKTFDTHEKCNYKVAQLILCVDDYQKIRDILDKYPDVLPVKLNDKSRYPLRAFCLKWEPSMIIDSDKSCACVGTLWGAEVYVDMLAGETRAVSEEEVKRDKLE